MSERESIGAPQRVAQTAAPTHDRVNTLDRWLLEKFMQAIGNPPLQATLWDGQGIAGSPAPTIGMTIQDRAALWRLFTNPQLNFGEDYSAGRIRIDGELTAFLETVFHTMEQRPPRPALLRKLTDTNTLSGSRDNIHHHYDLGNDFYRLWLDPEMVYTCAYYPQAQDSLETAQQAKMELVCRKLRLQPGQSVVEAGCGWGSLARYMARHYGVKVRAFNISREQIAYARDRAKAEGLSGAVDYVEADYRDISGTYDAFVSVGMMEHVGPKHYRELGGIVARTLKDEGLGLIHTIGQNLPQPTNPWLLKRIFPGSYPPTLREMMDVFEPYNLSVLDLENLRLHYARTLEQWLERFEAHRDEVEAMFDAAFVRTWRLYLSGCIANFRLGNLQLFQVLFARPGNNRVPWTRAHLFAAADS